MITQCSATLIILYHNKVSSWQPTRIDKLIEFLQNLRWWYLFNVPIFFTLFCFAYKLSQILVPFPHSQHPLSSTTASFSRLYKTGPSGQLQKQQRRTGASCLGNTLKSQWQNSLKSQLKTVFMISSKCPCLESQTKANTTTSFLTIWELDKTQAIQTTGKN